VIGECVFLLLDLVFGRPFVKQFALCYQTVVLSVMLVYCGQTVGWIKMKLSMQAGFSPSHTALDGDPAPPTERGTAAPHFRNSGFPLSYFQKNPGFFQDFPEPPERFSRTMLHHSNIEM